MYMSIPINTINDLKSNSKFAFIVNSLSTDSTYDQLRVNYYTKCECIDIFCNAIDTFFQNNIHYL